MERFESKRLSVFKAAWNLLTRPEKIRLALVAIIQFFLGLLDLVGVAAIATLGALSVRGVQSQQPGDTVGKILDLLHLSNLNFRSQAMIIALLAALLLISKTILSVILTRRVNLFLSRRSARLSGDLIEKAFAHSYLFLKSYSQQELLFALTAGVNALTIGVMAPSVALIADVSLLLIMSSGLLFVEPILTVCSFFVFGSVAVLLHKSLIRRASTLGNLDTELNITSTSSIVELLSTYRESVVQGSIPQQVDRIKEVRKSLASTSAEMSFMPNISKYVMEVTLILSGLFLGAFAFALGDAVHAIATLVLFLAAGFRIAPAILRIQQGLIVINASIASAQPTMDIASRLSIIEANPIKVEVVRNEKILTPVKIEIQNLSYRYPGQREDFFSNLNLRIEPGDAVAIVGPSGAGKTTLVDLLLGILEPSSGEINLDELKSSLLCSSRPGDVAYVPQNSFLINSSLYKNVILGLDETEVPEALVIDALRQANLLDFAMELPNKLDQFIGDSGIQLSGGQKQRLGLARAFVTKPRLLVLDEATSALDAETEDQINRTLVNLKGKVTVIVIAHRLATLRSMDRVIYMDNGKILGDASFDSLRATIPDFDHQAKLMGL